VPQDRERLIDEGIVNDLGDRNRNFDEGACFGERSGAHISRKARNKHFPSPARVEFNSEM